jgi:hypothetical protein
MSILKLFHPFKADGLTRLGHKYDGGYIVHAESLKDADYLINYGVGYNVVFEKDFFKETGKPTLAFDPTLKDFSPVLKNLSKGRFIPAMRHFKNYFIWKTVEPTLKKYSINFIEEGISDKDTPEYKTFKYHFDKYNLANKKLIFKLDVEGFEYEIFRDKTIYPLLGNALQIYIEFHYVERRINEIAEIITNLEKTHSLVHLHANNHADFFNYNGKMVPEAMEATFLLNEYLPNKQYSTLNYPVEGLDMPCDRLKEDPVLDFFY